MLYAKDEKCNIISKNTLDSIKNKTILERKHEMFNELNNSH